MRIYHRSFGLIAFGLPIIIGFMKLRLIILLALFFSLSSMINPIFPRSGNEINIDSIVKSDSVKYIIFTSSEDRGEPGIRRTWFENTRNYVFYLNDICHRNMMFSTQKDVSATVKPKSFLKTVKSVDWNVLSKAMSKDEADKMHHFFIHECHQWKRKSGKETKLYFIDRNDFSGDTIRMYRVYCSDARNYMNQIIDELDY